MADLTVDYDLLTEFERNLSFVRQEFKDLHHDVHHLDANSGWGSDDVKGAMKTFADNWSYHRSKLESSIDTLLQMVTQTKGTFTDVDRQLAQALAKDTDENAPAPHGGGHVPAG